MKTLEPVRYNSRGKRRGIKEKVQEIVEKIKYFQQGSNERLYLENRLIYHVREARKLGLPNLERIEKIAKEVVDVKRL